MGRGRAKAKQTRVARDLKYRTFDTDFSSLERELRGTPGDGDAPVTDEEYSEYAERYEADDTVDEADDADDEDEADDYGRRYG